MATAIPNSNINIPFSSFLDPITGRPSQEWLMFLMNPTFISANLSAALPVTSGGTGLTTIPTNGKLLIGNGTGYSLNTLTAGTGITVTNGAGTITVASTGVTSVGGTGTVNGITLTGTVTTTGNLTLGGTLSGVSLTTQVSGILPIANGGTGTSVAGVSATIVTAKLTALGANGSMTFTNGLLTAQTPAT